MSYKKIIANEFSPISYKRWGKHSECTIVRKIRHGALLDKLCLCQYLSCSFDRLSEIYRTSTTLTFLHLLFESI